MVNVERLRKELEFVTSHQDEWDQGIYAERTACGTTACLAGNTVLHDGLRLNWIEHLSGCYIADALETGELIHSAAARILGLDDDQAEDLFEGGMTLRRLWAYACQITKGEIDIPANLPLSSWGGDDE